MKIEHDRVKILSGLRGGVTLGSPVTLVIENRDWVNWSSIMDPIKPIPANLGLRERRLAFDTHTPRPGHADLAGGIKLNHHDLRNVLERASARETAARVAVGSLARQLLERFGVEFASHVVRIGRVKPVKAISLVDLERLRRITEESPVRCADAKAGREMMAAIREAKKKRDSLGGVAEIIIRGVPVGLGGLSQWDQRLDGRLAGALMALPSVKGVEIGLGFAASALRGSQCQDPIYYDAKGDPRKMRFIRRSNNAGGIEGGITNGEDIVFRVAAKPLSTLNQPLDSVNVVTKQPAKAMVERSDHCIVPALAVICESVAALVIADAFLVKFGSDNMTEIERNHRGWLESPY
jgi:chorismate synthase